MKKAFTLIEILLVLILLAVAAALSLPNFDKSYAQVQLHKTSDDLDYLMRYAQSRAITHDHPVRLVFGPSLQSYRLEEQSHSSDSDDAKAWQPITGRWGKTVTVSRDMTLKAPQDFIEFAPDGSMTRTVIHVCYKQDCLEVSTQEQRGKVEVLGENPH